MKAGWEVKTLGEVCDILDNQRKPITKRDRIAGKYPYYGATGILDYVEDYIFDEKLVLVGEDGAKWASGENTAFSVEGKVWVNNHAHVIRPHRNIVLDNWLIYFLNHSDLTEFVSGLTVPKLNQANLRGIQIPFPKLPEQQRIVAILDKAFASIATAKANTEQNLKNARALFDSYLHEVFSQRGEGWEEKPLSDFTHSISTGPFGSLLHKSDYVSEGVPLVNPINIVNGYIVPNCDKQINEATKQRLQSYILQEGDIVIGRRGEIGRCAVVTSEQAGWVCGTGCFFIRPLQTVNPYFLVNLIRSSKYREQLENLSSGATMLNLSNKALSELLITIPSFNEQQNILEKLDDIQKETQRLETLYQRKLTALDELKKSLLHKAFNGDI